jgi:hypothetical protein
MVEARIMSAVQFIEYYDGISGDMFVNIIYCEVLYDKKNWSGFGYALWVYKTGDETAELEAAKEKFMAEELQGKEFVKAEFEHANGNVIVVKGTKLKRRLEI